MAWSEWEKFGGVDITSMSAETHSGNVTNKDWLTFVPNVPFEKIKIIRVHSEQFSDGSSVKHKLNSVYWLEDGVIYESWTDYDTNFKIENGAIMYSQVPTSLSKPMSCTVYY